MQEPVQPKDVHDLIVRALAYFEEPAEARADGVWLSKWPTARISVDRAIVFPAPSAVEAWTAWVDLTLMYNTALPFTAAKSHVIGLGGGGAQALFDAVENWRKGVAPALISYIYGVLREDADTWPPDHPRAIPGWTCINGPYVLRGDATRIETLIALLQEHPLLRPVREHLCQALDRAAAIHTVSLYRAQRHSEIFADVLVDNQTDDVAGELLRSSKWPEELDDPQFIAVRHFLLCVADERTTR